MYWRIPIAIAWLFILLPSSISAQEEEKALSPFTVGVEFGTRLNWDFDADERDAFGLTYHQVGATTSYRLTRWLSVTASLQYHRMQAHLQPFTVRATVSSPNEILDRSLRQQQYVLLLGARFMYRIWQGDLAAEIAVGPNYRTAQMDAISNRNGLIDINYRPEYGTMTNLQLSYTYWPKDRFGISVAVAQQAWFRSNSTSLFATLQPDENLSEKWPDLPLELGERMHPGLNEYTEILKLIVGVEYRL